MPFTNFAVAKDVTHLHEFVDQLHTAVIIPWQVVTIREVEGVDVPVIRIVALLDDLQGQLICRRDLSTAALTFVEELFLRDLFRFGVVTDKDDMHVVVLRTQEAYHPEVETTCNILLKFTHTPANIHHCYNYSVGLIFNRRFPHFK